MVRKIIVFMVALLMLLTAFCGGASAATYTPYEGTISSTYLTYAKDIVSNIGLQEHYVFVRTDQYTYQLFVGDVIYSDGVFSSDTSCTVYTFTSNSSYNSYISYSVSSLDHFTLSVSDHLLYSDLGNYPQLEERGQKYEILQTILFSVFLLCIVIRCIFFTRKS